MDDETVATVVGITGCSEDVARSLLQMANGDMERAIGLILDNPEIAQTVSQQQSGSAGGAPTLPPIQTSTSSFAQSSRPSHYEDAQGVVHIDSDEDEDNSHTLDDDDDGVDQAFEFGATAAASIARSAQEDEDAAMAKRLQEELYGENSTTTDGVRAPIARTTETLMEPTYGGAPDDVNTAFLEHMRRRNARPRTQNPFGQSVWDNATPSSVNPDAQSSRRARLAEMYRPPHELISRLTWDEARADGREDKKWLLVNIQDMADFNCQILNRDIWKDEAIQQLVQENFIFLQYPKGALDAEQYIQYYMGGGLADNPDNYPHVAIVDPRTGEQVKVWAGRPFPDALDFHAQLAEFLDRYSLDANSKNPVAKAKSRQQVKNFERMTEEEMLEMAMQNSLETGNRTSSAPNIEDPDELTASAADLGKGKEKVQVDSADSTEPAEAQATSAQSSFAKISADRPHEEPANDPATTTRIQFRHSGGRIIRRFAVADPVIRLYEWLKASPLEGKDGLEFELKLMPQGRDLIQDLDKTVEEAEVKQATVMIEYLEG